MAEQVLSDAEKNALLDGMSTGAVEVQNAAGEPYADVHEFEIGPRSRIETHSFPRLVVLNRQLAERLGRNTARLFNRELDVAAHSAELSSFSDVRDAMPDPCLAAEFAAAPLPGSGLLYLSPELVGHLVDSFFGGCGQEPELQNKSSFTAGELIVANIFVNEALQTIRETWTSLVELSPERLETRLGTDTVDAVDPTEPVIATEFEMTFSDLQGKFCIVWPMTMISSLVPVLEGQKRERDAAEDARWEDALRKRIADIRVNLSTFVGNVNLIVGDLVGLKPGDTIDIDDPRNATVFSNKVPVLEGRFGVHEGSNAIEMTSWADSDLHTPY